MTPRGFSLIEVMMVVMIAGIVLATGIPGFLAFQRTLAKIQTRERLIQDLRYARQLAVTQHRSVVVAFGDGVTTTDITTYKVHIDADGNRALDSGEWITNKSLPRGVKLTHVLLTPTDSLIFDPSGSLWPGTSGGRLVFHNGRGQPDTLMISGVGMVYNP